MDFLVVGVAYLLGAIPTAYIAGRLLRGIDIRLLGSGNPGALNVYRHVGAAAGLAVLGSDAAKGFAAIWMVQALASNTWPEYAAAAAVVVGHNWSVFLGFGGGKGVATLLGVSFAIMPLLTAFVIPFTVLVLLVTRKPVPAFAGGIIFLNLLLIATTQPPAQILLCLALSALVAGTHFYRSGARIMPVVRSKRWWQVVDIE